MVERQQEVLPPHPPITGAPPPGAEGPDGARFDAWVGDLSRRPGGDAYARLLDAHRRYLDVISSTAPSAELLLEAADRLDSVCALLEQDRTAPGGGLGGNRYDLPGRGHPHLVPLRTTLWTAREIRGDVTFTASHVGGNGAVHGGVLPLLFDEVLGRLANTNHSERTRTAYLRTDYRHVTLLGVRHVLDAGIDVEDGRKRFLSARLRDDAGRLVAEAQGLFVVLREDAP